MAKIAHLSSVHRAHDTRILHRECRSLTEAGFSVVLIAEADYDFVEHGVRVRALPKMDGGRLARMTRQVYRVWKMALEEKADLYFFHDPELIPVGLALRMRGYHVVYDVHESISKLILSKEWLPGWSRGAISRAYRLLEILIGKAFSGIVAATPGIAEFFPPTKVAVIQNFPIVSELSSSDDIHEHDHTHGKVVTYVGSITEERGILEMVKAMSLLPNEQGYRLVLGGRFAPESLIEKAMNTPGWDKVNYMGMLSRAEVASTLQRSCVGLVTLHPVPNHLDSYPVKLFEYMAAGLPVVASNFPFWEQFVEDVGSGVMVDPMDPQAIADGILEIVNDPERARSMSDAGRRAVRERFTWDTEAEKLVSVVEALVGEP